MSKAKWVERTGAAVTPFLDDGETAEVIALGKVGWFTWTGWRGLVLTNRRFILIKLGTWSRRPKGRPIYSGPRQGLSVREFKRGKLRSPGRLVLTQPTDPPPSLLVFWQWNDECAEMAGRLTA
jgi:hypothetical protein